MGGAPSLEISTKQSPPIPVDWGSTTHCTAQAATAASTALPPALSTSSAAPVASGCEVAAMPFSARTAERPGSSRFLMASVLPRPRGLGNALLRASSAGFQYCPGAAHRLRRNMAMRALGLECPQLVRYQAADVRPRQRGADGLPPVRPRSRAGSGGGVKAGGSDRQPEKKGPPNGAARVLSGRKHHGVW